MRSLDSITDLMDMSLSKLWEILKDRDAQHATGLGVAKSPTRLSGFHSLSGKLLFSTGSSVQCSVMT